MTNKILWSTTRSRWEAHVQHGVLVVREPGSDRWMKLSERDTAAFLSAYDLTDD